MIKKISLKYRLILPIALLGIVALLSNILSILNIRNVNASASTIADNYMDGKSQLAELCQSSMEIHKMALSHIVATDYNTMITLVQQIKEKEALLDEMAASYQRHVCHIPRPTVDISKFSTFFSFPRHISRPKVCISHFP